jgi:hypothetical protein
VDEIRLGIRSTDYILSTRKHNGKFRAEPPGMASFLVPVAFSHSGLKSGHSTGAGSS